MLDSCALHSDWKKANICRIFKGGDSTVPVNHGPVSLTSEAVKLFERLLSFILLSAAEQLFCRGCRCVTYIFVARGSLAKAVDNGHAIDLLFFDYAKAFDTVLPQRH